LKPLQNKDKTGMSRKKWIIGGVVVGAAVVFWVKAAASKIENNIKYSFSNPKVRFGLNTEIDIDLTVTNNNSISVELMGFTGDLLYGEKDLGDVTAQPVEMMANSTSTTTITTSIALFDAANSIMSLIQSGQYLNELKVIGKIRLKHPKTGLQINIPYNEKVI
jgi:hypothetical protein